MAKYRKKPVVIEAVQYRKGGPIPEGVCVGRDGCTFDAGVCDSEGNTPPHIHTLEGVHYVSDGDWVITGVKGEKYPCKPEIFAMTYEPELDASGAIACGITCRYAFGSLGMSVTVPLPSAFAAEGAHLDALDLDALEAKAKEDVCSCCTGVDRPPCTFDGHGCTCCKGTGRGGGVVVDGAELIAIVAEVRGMRLFLARAAGETK